MGGVASVVVTAVASVVVTTVASVGGYFVTDVEEPYQFQWQRRKTSITPSSKFDPPGNYMTLATSK